MNSNLLQSVIKLEERGNNGIGKAMGFSLISDSLFLFNSRFEKKMSYVQTNGSVTGIIHFDGEKTSPANFFQGRSCVFLDSKFCVIPQSYLGLIYGDIEKLKKHNILLKYDLSNGIFEEINLKLPFLQSKNLHRDLNYSITQSENGYVIAFRSWHDIFYTEDFNVFENIQCQTSNIKDIPGKNSKSQDINDLIKEAVKNDCYFDFVWNKYNKLYYRFYKIGKKEINKDTDIYNLNHFPEQLGLMVMNSEFEILSDELLTPSKFYYNNYFITPEGLYLSLNHPNNPGFNADSIKFELITIEKNE